jgi:hypothetical protein
VGNIFVLRGKRYERTAKAYRISAVVASACCNQDGGSETGLIRILELKEHGSFMAFFEQAPLGYRGILTNGNTVVEWI